MGVTCIAAGCPQASSPSHPFPSRSTPLTSEFTTSLTRPSPAFNAQVHTETSLALLPSCGESLLVDSMCCVASGPGGVFDRGTWISCNTRYGRHRLADSFNEAEPRHQPAKNLVPYPTATKLSKHEPTHNRRGVQAILPSRCWCASACGGGPLSSRYTRLVFGRRLVDCFNAAEPRPRNP